MVVEAAVPIAVTVTEWVARYKPPTVTVAVLKIRWTTVVSGVEDFACFLCSSLPSLHTRLKLCGEPTLFRAGELRAPGHQKT